jgi:hypothetical protein
MSNPTSPQDDETKLTDHAKYVHHRLADMLIKVDLSPYKPLPDKIELNYPLPPFSVAVKVLLEATELKTPDPKVKPPKKSPVKRPK